MAEEAVEEEEENEKEPGRGRFMRNGDSARPESPLICASVEPTKESATEEGRDREGTRRRERKREEGEKRTHRRWYHRQMHLHSVLLHLVQLSGALLPTDRDKVRGVREREIAGNVTVELFYSIMQYLYASDDKGGEERGREGSDPDREWERGRGRKG